MPHIRKEMIYKEINGKPVENIDITEYENNGEQLIKGHINETPIYYENTANFRKKQEKHVTFREPMPHYPHPIWRVQTPFRECKNRRQTRRKKRRNKTRPARRSKKNNK